MMITFHAPKHETTGVSLDAHSPHRARYQMSERWLQIPLLRQSCTQRTQFEPRNHCQQEQSLIKGGSSQEWEKTSPFPSTEYGGMLWALWCREAFGERGMQKFCPKLPLQLAAHHEVLHGAHPALLLLLNCLPAKGTGQKELWWTQVTSQTLWSFSRSAVPFLDQDSCMSLAGMWLQGWPMGQPGTQTGPAVLSTVGTLAFNPSWHVFHLGKLLSLLEGNRSLCQRCLG